MSRLRIIGMAGGSAWKVVGFGVPSCWEGEPLALVSRRRPGVWSAEVLPLYSPIEDET